MQTIKRKPKMDIINNNRTRKEAKKHPHLLEKKPNGSLKWTVTNFDFQINFCETITNEILCVSFQITFRPNENST